MLPFGSKLYTHSHMFYCNKRKTDILSHLRREMEKTEPKEAYSADTTQQPIHIKASPNQAEHAVVCHWGIVLFLCNTQMIKEFNTASRLMTPLGCRGTQERRRQGLWRILAETLKSSKIYKFIHQKAGFLCHRCAYVSVCRWRRVNVSEEGGGGERKREGKRDSKSDISPLWAIKHQATGNNHHEKNCKPCHNVVFTFCIFSSNCIMDILNIINKWSWSILTGQI